MGLNLKLGKGGHGLEVYDDEGKYAEEFSFDFGGQQIKGYDDFRALYFASSAENSAGQFTAEDLENIYNQSSEFKQQVDEGLYPEYNKCVTEAVNEHNAKQVWDTPEEAAKHVHELFVPNLVKNLIDNNILTQDRSVVSGDYKVPTLVACLQMSRYHRNKANVITADEYRSVMNTRGAKGNLQETGPNSAIEKYINDALANGNCIPVNRCISGVSARDKKAVLESFYEENSPRHSCLSTYSAMMGTVIYCSTGNNTYYTNAARIDGFVDLSKGHKILNCPVDYYEGGANNKVPEINRFRDKIKNDPDFDNKLLQKFTEAGLNQYQSATLLQKVRNSIQNDIGFCGMLMGYDAIYGLSFQFDILNLAIWNVIKQ